MASGAPRRAPDAAPAGPPPTPDNVNQVGRFPDEVEPERRRGEDRRPTDRRAQRRPRRRGRRDPPPRHDGPAGRLARQLHSLPLRRPEELGAHARGVDRKGGLRRRARPSPRRRAAPAGQTRLIFDEQDFCGHLCKNDSDCQAGQTCAGKANLLTNGKPGADTTRARCRRSAPRPRAPPFSLRDRQRVRPP